MNYLEKKDKKFYEENKEYINEKRKKYRKKNLKKVQEKDRMRNKTTKRQEQNRKNSLKPQRRFYQLIDRCKRKNLFCDISFEKFVELISQSCFYCGNVVLNSPGVSLDRRDNLKGYMLDNVLPCCKSCNLIRGVQLTVDETKVAIEAIMKFRNYNSEVTRK